jgi:hypothetical protein
MKNTNSTTTLKLRAHSIRNLTAAELRLANGGKWWPTQPPHSSKCPTPTG